MTLEEMQKEVINNKIAKGFDMKNIDREFCLLYGEVGEAYEAWLKKKDDLGAELADVAIYLLGIADMLGFSLHDEITRKIEINKNRKYEVKNGVLQKK